jgi:hypothetical protein
MGPVLRKLPPCGAADVEDRVRHSSGRVNANREQEVRRPEEKLK